MEAKIEVGQIGEFGPWGSTGGGGAIGFGKVIKGGIEWTFNSSVFPILEVGYPN